MPCAISHTGRIAMTSRLMALFIGMLLKEIGIVEWDLE